MASNERAQPLTDVALEYIVHGTFFWKESEVNAVHGAWWVPLGKLVKLQAVRGRVLAEYITEKIDEFDEEVKSMRRAAIAAAEADSSEEEN